MYAFRSELYYTERDHIHHMLKLTSCQMLQGIYQHLAFAQQLSPDIKWYPQVQAS